MDSQDAPLLGIRWPLELDQIEHEQYDPWEDEKQRKREILDSLAEPEARMHINWRELSVLILLVFLTWATIWGLWLMADWVIQLAMRWL